VGRLSIFGMGDATRYKFGTTWLNMTLKFILCIWNHSYHTIPQVSVTRICLQWIGNHTSYCCHQLHWTSKFTLRLTYLLTYLLTRTCSDDIVLRALHCFVSQKYSRRHYQLRKIIYCLVTYRAGLRTSDTAVSGGSSRRHHKRLVSTHSIVLSRASAKLA